MDCDLNCFKTRLVSGHGIITAVVITDLLAFSPIPKLRRQFVFPILFAVTWFVFSYVYYVSGGLGLKRHDPDEPPLGKPYLYKASICLRLH